MKKKNAGFSLVEVVVVIAIIAILSGGVTTLVLNQSKWRCKKAAEHISYALSETRSQSLAKSKAWVEIAYDDVEGYLIKSSYAVPVYIGKSCEIGYTTAADTSGQVTAGNPLILSYARDSGAFLAMIDSVTDGTTDYGKTSYTFDYKTESGGDLMYCKTIVISKGGVPKYQLVLNKETGRHEVETE